MNLLPEGYGPAPAAADWPQATPSRCRPESWSRHTARAAQPPPPTPAGVARATLRPGFTAYYAVKFSRCESRQSSRRINGKWTDAASSVGALVSDCTAVPGQLAAGGRGGASSTCQPTHITIDKLTRHCHTIVKKLLIFSIFLFL